MTAITFTNLNFTGTADDFDNSAMTFIVNLENKKITAANASKPAPDPLYPMTTAADLKASYLKILLIRDSEIHASYIAQAADAELAAAMELVRKATKAQRTAAIAALTS